MHTQPLETKFNDMFVVPPTGNPVNLHMQIMWTTNERKAMQLIRHESAQLSTMLLLQLLGQCFSNFFIPSSPFHSRHVVFAPQA